MPANSPTADLLSETDLDELFRGYMASEMKFTIITRARDLLLRAAEMVVRRMYAWTPASVIPKEHGQYLCVVRHGACGRPYKRVLWFHEYNFPLSENLSEDECRQYAADIGATYDDDDGHIIGTGWHDEIYSSGDLITQLFAGGQTDGEVIAYRKLEPMPS